MTARDLTPAQQAALIPALALCVDVMDAMDMDDDSEFCPGCNPEPTIGELESNYCYSCGKQMVST